LDSEFNSVSPELDSTFAAAAGGLLAGMIIGGMPASKLAHEDFIARNKASTFENHIEAKVSGQLRLNKSKY
jgi:hypothetical protein